MEKLIEYLSEAMSSLSWRKALCSLAATTSFYVSTTYFPPKNHARVPLSKVESEGAPNQSPRSRSRALASMGSPTGFPQQTSRYGAESSAESLASTVEDPSTPAVGNYEISSSFSPSGASLGAQSFYFAENPAAPGKKSSPQSAPGIGGLPSSTGGIGGAIQKQDVSSSADSSSSTSSTTSTTTPSQVSLTVTSSGWKNLCQKVTINILDSDGDAAYPVGAMNFTISSDLGALYEDENCATVASSVTAGITNQTKSFYFKSTAAGTATLTVAETTITTKTGTIEVGTPTASLVLGQTNFTSNTNNSGGVSGSTLYYPYNAQRYGDYLIATDESNHRVLIWNSLPTTNGQAADVVLGQTNSTSNTCNNGGISASTLCTPDYVYYDGTHLLVADSANHRVLIWSSMPTTTGQAANIVLGQTTTAANTDNSGGLSASSLSYPECVFSNGTKVVVCDAGNNRVLIWNSFPTGNKQAADVVVGQASMATSASGTSTTAINYPYMAHIFSEKLFVNDYSNNRVLIYNTVPTSNGAAADVVVGQSDFVTNTANAGGLSASSLRGPGDVQVDSQGRMFIADFSNNRVLIWNEVPSSNGAAANAVIGQSNLTSAVINSGGVSSTSLYNPWGLSVYNSELWISDLGNNRILKLTAP